MVPPSLMIPAPLEPSISCRENPVTRSSCEFQTTSFPCSSSAATNAGTPSITSRLRRSLRSSSARSCSRSAERRARSIARVVFSSSCCARNGLITYPNAPLFRAPIALSTLASPVMMTTWRWGLSRRSRSASSKPWTSGKCRSINASSNTPARATSNASSAVRTETHSTAIGLSSLVRISTMLSASSVWSSTTSTRAVALPTGSARSACVAANAVMGLGCTPHRAKRPNAHS